MQGPAQFSAKCVGFASASRNATRTAWRCARSMLPVQQGYRNKQEVTALNRSILKPPRTCPRPPTLPKEWTSLTLPVGRSEHSWGIASGGALLSESERSCRFSSASQGCYFLKKSVARTCEIPELSHQGLGRLTGSDLQSHLDPEQIDKPLTANNCPRFFSHSTSSSNSSGTASRFKLSTWASKDGREHQTPAAFDAA